METIHDVEWSWSGWDDGEEVDPAEPGKKWLTINHWGDEYAVIVHRMVPDLDNRGIMQQKEGRAQRIVAALSSRNLDEALINIRMSLSRLGPWLGRGYYDLEEVAADLGQALRFLEGKEEPS